MSRSTGRDWVFVLLRFVAGIGLAFLIIFSRGPHHRLCGPLAEATDTLTVLREHPVCKDVLIP